MANEDSAERLTMKRAYFGFRIACLLVCLPAFAAATQALCQSPPQASSASSDKVEDVNAAVVQARAATKEKRYTDAEALMLKVTREKPELVVPWVELGLAQLGLKKYPEAEVSFKMAIGIDPASLQRTHSEDFYQLDTNPTKIAPSATRANRDPVTHSVNNGKERPPAVLGGSYASLGEIYMHEGKFADAKAAFDAAVRDNPPQAAFYRGNETILSYQAGNSDAQLQAAEQAIALDPNRAALYYFKAQALTAKATVDPKTQKLILPPGCVEAYQKYLQLDPKGQFSADAKGVLDAAGTGAPGKT